jgi:outer membrane lipoprotein-sorting protein
MMKMIGAASLLCVAALLGGPCPAGAQSLGPDQIVRRAEQSVFPDSFVMQATLRTLESGAVTSNMQMSVTFKRGVGSRIELLSPPRSRGMRFLQKEDALWLFNPAAGSSQAIRLSPKAAFQGSVFSNRDVGDPQYSTEYTMSVQGTETLDHPELGKVAALVLEGTARNEMVAYSRVKLWVRASDDMLLTAEYYAKSGLLFKRAVFTGIRPMAGRERPTVIRMVSLDQPNRESIMTVTSLEEKPDLPDALFTLAALTR